MKKLVFIGFLLCGFLSANAFAEAVPQQITDGRFSIYRTNGTYPGEANYNAVIQTDKFSAASYLGGNYSPWNEICPPSYPACRPGRSFTVPQNSTVYIGGCVGGCSGPQFAGGRFVIGGAMYENAFFSGSLTFSRETFTVPRTIKRKGLTALRKPFTMTGRLKVCSVRDYETSCPADKTLFDGEIAGRGTLTVLLQVKAADRLSGDPVSLHQKSIDYQFHP